MNARKIEKSYVSLTGAIFSYKNNRQIYYESSLERDFIETLEFDKNVEEYIEQPIKIIFGNRKYHPDFFVRYTKRAKLKYGLVDSYVEIKYTAELEFKKEYYQIKFDAVKDVVNKQGLDFKIITELDIRTEYLENIKFLSYYKNKPVNELTKDQILEVIKLQPLISASTIRDDLPGSFEDKARIVFVTWSLLASGFIKANLKSKLTMESELWIR